MARRDAAANPNNNPKYSTIASDLTGASCMIHLAKRAPHLMPFHSIWRPKFGPNRTEPNRTEPNRTEPNQNETMTILLTIFVCNVSTLRPFWLTRQEQSCLFKLNTKQQKLYKTSKQIRWQDCKRKRKRKRKQMRKDLDQTDSMKCRIQKPLVSIVPELQTFTHNM